MFVLLELHVCISGNGSVQQEFTQVFSSEAANDTPDIETLADMLIRGELPKNYDNIDRDISDDDFEPALGTFQ